MRPHTLGSLTIAGCALSWGIIGIIVSEVDLPAMAIVFWRVAFSALSVVAGLLIVGRRDLLSMAGNRSPLALGVLLAVHWSLYFAAIKETSVASAVLVTYSAPIFMALLAPALIRERVPRITVVALGVSAAGIAAISLSSGGGGGEVRVAGILLALAAAVTYALLIVLVKRWANEMNPITFVVYEDVSASVVLLPALLAGGMPSSGSDLLYLAVLGVILTGATGIVYIAAVQMVPATTAGILAYMEPVSAAVLAVILLGEDLGPWVIAGGLAIVAAGAAVILRTPDPLVAPIEEPVPAG